MIGMLTVEMAAAKERVLAERADDSVTVYSYDPKESYRPAWEYVKKCSGLKEKKGGRYEDVKWRAVQPHGMGENLGLWVAPDTILIDSLYVHAPWVIAHELLHHLMQPAPEEDKHPANPFVFPCMLTTPQNIPWQDWKHLP